MKGKIDNLPLTKCKINIKGDIYKLGMGAREYKKHEYVKKDSGNRLLHWDSLKNLICSNVQCSRCGLEVNLHENTIGIATQVGLTCTNKLCNLKEENKVKRTLFRKYNFRTNSNESFAVNCQLVLAMLQIGCGSTEAGVLLTFLDLPNSSAFHRMSFSRILTAIRPEIKEITNLCMEHGQNEEIKQTIGEELYEEYKKGNLSSDEVGLVIMYDMGWNKHSSGNKYDSISGHRFVLGGNLKKIINYRCMSKCCRICALAECTKVSVDHESPKKYEGSSKSMETEAIYQMVQDAYYNKGSTCSVIVSDDNSTIKSNLKHSFKQKVEEGLMSMEQWPKTKQNRPRQDNGRLPLKIPEPRFLADFNHRVKTVGKAVYALATVSKKESSVTKEIAARMKTYWGSMLKQIRYLDWDREGEKIKERVLATVEHLFNNHQYCDEKWCYVLRAQKEGKPYCPEDSRPLYEENADPKMYEQLKKAVERFQTKENIVECLHKYDTQQNEGLNMSVSRYVPKFKHYGTSMSLDTRIRCVVGTHNMGYSTFYSTLLANLGCIEKRDGENRHLSSGITRIGKTKLRHRTYKQKLEVKRRRKHGQQARTRQQIFVLFVNNIL